MNLQTGKQARRRQKMNEIECEVQNLFVVVIEINWVDVCKDGVTQLVKNLRNNIK